MNRKVPWLSYSLQYVLPRPPLWTYAMLMTRSLPFIFLLLLPLFSMSQLSGLPVELKNNFSKYISSFKPERIYVSTDRSLYRSGDTIFFRLYFVDARTNKPLTTGSNIFVDLVSPFGKLVRKAILNPSIANTGGYFILPATTEPGFYTIRAFTRWMAESAPATIYQKGLVVEKKNSAIEVRSIPADTILANMVQSKMALQENSSFTTITLNTGKEKFSIPLQIEADQPQINFYIEGQQIINGVQNRIAIKALDRFGRGIKIKGMIRDQYGTGITGFQTNEYGLGTCNVFGVKGRKYTSYIDTGSVHLSFPLADVKDSAYQVSVVERNANVIRLRVSLGDALYRKNIPTTIVAVSGNEMVFAANGRDMYEVNLPVANLSPGITNITLFNERLEPVSERNIFMPQQEPLLITNIQAQNKTIAFMNNDSVDMQWNISISDREFNGPNGESIRSALLLGAAFSNSFAVNERIYGDSLLTDILMLCMPGEMIQWERIMAGNYPSFNGSGEQLLNLQGWIQDKNGKPAPGRVLAIFSNDHQGRILIDTTDAYGTFSLNNLAFTDTARFIIQSRNKRGIKQPDTIYVTENNFPALPFQPTSLQQYIQCLPVYSTALVKQLHTYDSIAGFENAKELEAVIVSKRKSADSRDKKRVSGFSTIICAEEIIRLGAVNIADALTLIPGVTKTGGFIRIRGSGSLTASAQQMEPLLVIDGTAYPVYDSSSSISNLLASIPANIVDFIEILKGGEAAYYGTRGSNGVIMVYTKADFTMGFGWEEPGVKAFQALGYHIPVRGKTVGKSRTMHENKITPTIYWEQDIKLDPKNLKKVVIERNAVPATLLMRLEGITPDGRIIYHEAAIDDQTSSKL